MSGFHTKAQQVNPDYDSSIAKKYGADDYGMKMYVLVILKTGSNRITDKSITDSLFAGHLNNIKRLASLNKLVLAGPLSKNEKTYRGIYIFDVKTFEEAEKLLETDPAVKAKLLAAELYNWYGAAALPAYLDTYNKTWKSGF